MSAQTGGDCAADPHSGIEFWITALQSTVVVKRAYRFVVLPGFVMVPTSIFVQPKSSWYL